MTATSAPEQAPRTARPAAPAGGAGGGGLTGRDILQILRKRKWFITVWVVALTVLSGVATLLWSMYSPLYTAEALLEVVPPKTSELTTSRDLYGKDIMDRLTAMAAQMVHSSAVLNEALRAERVRKTTWYQQARKDRIVQELADALSVSPVATTNFVRVQMTGSIKRDLPEIVNAVAEAAALDSKKALTKDHENAMAKLRQKERELKKELDAVHEQALRARPKEIPNIQDRVNILNIRLQTFTTLMSQMEASRAQALAAMQAAELQAETGALARSPEVQAALEADPALRSMRVAEINLNTEYDNLLQKLGRNHRTVKDVKARLENVRVQIQARTDKVVQDQVEFLLNHLRASYAAQNSQYEDIKAKYDLTTATARDLQANLEELKTLSAKEEALTEDLRKISSALLERTLLEGGQAQVRLRREADEPREPSWPKWRVMMPLGVILGLVVGFGLTFLLEFVDTSIKAPSDVTRRVDLPLLGMIPHADDLEEQIPDMRLAFSTAPNSLVSESFRQIRTCLLFSGPASQRRVLMVASALPQDGRTTVALNLAASIAGGGRKVLVVDANFRQPAVARLFDACPPDGLSNAMVAQAEWQSLVREIQPNLFAMSSGPLPPNPAELLGSDAMRQMVAQMVEQYDQVIFDSAPCLVVADAPVLATLVDGVILVVRAGANTYGVVQKVRDMLTRVGAHVIGAVLNGLRVTAGGYLRKNYDTFYEYHEHDDGQAAPPAGRAAKRSARAEAGAAAGPQG